MVVCYLNSLVNKWFVFVYVIIIIIRENQKVIWKWNHLQKS